MNFPWILQVSTRFSQTPIFKPLSIHIATHFWGLAFVSRQTDAEGENTFKNYFSSRWVARTIEKQMRELAFWTEICQRNTCFSTSLGAHSLPSQGQGRIGDRSADTAIRSPCFFFSFRTYLWLETRQVSDCGKLTEAACGLRIALADPQT